MSASRQTSGQTAPRRNSGRFASRFDEKTLLEIVAAVARVVDPDEPGLVTQTDYDAAREDAGYPDAPTAKQTAARLGMSWGELLRFAVAPMARPEIALGRHLGESNEDWLDTGAVRSALKTVALRLGKKTLTPADYRQERQRMLDEAARALRHRREPVLPTEGQIERIAGSWDEALKVAALKARSKRPEVERGVSHIDAIELFLEGYGALPSTVELERFVRRHGFPLSKREMGHAEAIEQVRYRRLEWGKWTPLGIPRKRDRPDYSALVALPPSIAALSRRTLWTRETCLEALGRLMAERPGERLTLRRYQALAVGRLDLPALESVQRFGKWSEMVSEARSK